MPNLILLGGGGGLIAPLAHGYVAQGPSMSESGNALSLTQPKWVPESVLGCKGD